MPVCSRFCPWSCGSYELTFQRLRRSCSAYLSERGSCAASCMPATVQTTSRDASLALLPMRSAAIFLDFRLQTRGLTLSLEVQGHRCCEYYTTQIAVWLQSKLAYHSGSVKDLGSAICAARLRALVFRRSCVCFAYLRAHVCRQGSASGCILNAEKFRAASIF